VPSCQSPNGLDSLASLTFMLEPKWSRFSYLIGVFFFFGKDLIEGYEFDKRFFFFSYVFRTRILSISNEMESLHFMV
jgi:hypothetical protein